jgi:hypothetical protein
MNLKSRILSVVVALCLSHGVSANQIDQLEKELSQLKAQINALADSIETTDESKSTHGVSIGGYGELHFNQKVGSNNKIDFHRFVLFFGKEFNSRTRFYSEFEIEHVIASKDDEGEVELEQAYIEYDINQILQAKVGLFLVPVGITNETHEPDSFYGVERNNVEKNIIPATWWEGGVSVTLKPVDGITVDLAVHSGLNIDTSSMKYKIRDGRQKVSNAVANSAAYTTRVKYTAIPGLELAAALQYQSDITQSRSASDSKVDAILSTVHAIYTVKGLTVKGLYSQWNINQKIVAQSTIAGSDKQEGYFIEPSYRYDDLGVYARHSAWDNQAGSNANDSLTKRNEVGFNYWLADTVTLKADVYRSEVAGVTSKGLDLGMGYSF